MSGIKTAAIGFVEKGVSFLSTRVFQVVQFSIALATRREASEVKLDISQKKKNAITLVALAAIALSLLSIPFTMSSAPAVPKLPFDAAGGTGEATADEVSKLVDGHGRILILEWEIPGVASSSKGFGRDSFVNALRNHKEITVAGTEKIPFGPTSNSGLDGEDYLRILEQHHDVDAIFSYVGVPVLTDQHIASLEGKKIPKFATRLQTLSHDMPIKELFEAHLLHLVIVPNGMVAPGAKPPSNGREFFERNFTVITADNASSISY